MNKFFSFIDPRKVTKTSYQITFIILNIILVVAFLKHPITTFISTDPPPLVKPLDPRISGTTVEAGMHIENFHVFDLTNNKFILNAIVWFKFNPALISIDSIEKFSFEKGDILLKSKPITKIVGEKVLAQFRIKFSFTSNLNYRLFPINHHRIFITLTNKSVSPKEFIFDSKESSLSLSKNMLVQGWDKKKHATTTGYSVSQLDRHDKTTRIYHPVIVFSIDFVRSGIRQVFVLFIPLFIIFYLSIFTLSLPLEHYVRRITISIGNISAFIGYRFVLERVSPKVGYLMFIDNTFNLLLVLSVLVFMVNIATRDKRYQLVRGITVLAVHIIFLASWFYLCHYWVYN